LRIFRGGIRGGIGEIYKKKKARQKNGKKMTEEKEGEERGWAHGKKFPPSERGV